jgi:hypothetical protein
MSIKTRILKDKRLSSGRDITAGTRDGESSMLTNLPRKEPRDMIVNTDSISIEHSTSDQDFQCGELQIIILIILDLYQDNRRKYQTFKFDKVSHTIKSEYTKSYSLHIYSNGSGSYIQLTTTSSRWW